MVLTPEARYELRDGDRITFADVQCSYHREDAKKVGQLELQERRGCKAAI